MRVKLLPDNYAQGIAQELRLRRQELAQLESPYFAHKFYHYPETLEDAPTMEIPELHLFRDARGYLWAVVAWFDLPWNWPKLLRSIKRGVWEGV